MKSVAHVMKHANFQLHRGTPWRSYFENLTIDDKFINKRVRLFIHQTICGEEKISEFENSCLITFLKKYRSSHWRCSASFLKTLQHKCFPVKFAKLLRATLKNICKRVFLEVFYKKAIHRNFNNLRTKVVTDKCSAKKSIYMLTPCGCFL